MMQQRNTGEAREEQAGLLYGNYEGGQQHAAPPYEIPEALPLREGPGEKVYLPSAESMNTYRLLVFVISMIALLVFVIVCLVFVGGTGGWISFCAASFAILVIASTMISMKREGEK